jgi:glycosyltransferase involved in cell wall biosynthesis
MIKFSRWKIGILLGMILVFVILAYFLSKRRESFANKQYKYGIIICCYNRPEFLKKTLESLKHTNKEDLNQSIIYIIDDHSDNKETTKIIEDYDIKNLDGVDTLGLKINRNRHNIGIAKSLEKGFTYLYPKCEYLTNIDSDVLVKPNWLSKLQEVYERSNRDINDGNGVLVSGFNCTPLNCEHKILSSNDLYHVKRSIGGINTFFHRDKYDDYINVIGNVKNGAHWDWRLCDHCKRQHIPIIVSKPSVIQHIGFNGLNSFGKEKYDYAEDF